MLITNNFVLINFPKTGSSFVRKVLKDIYDKRLEKSIFLKLAIKLNLKQPLYEELLFPNIKFKEGIRNNIDQHGIYFQIPKEYLNKEIFTVVRNPYERLISIYEFKFWQENPQLEVNILKEKFPHFPNLTIDDFVNYLKLVAENSFTDKGNDIKIGFMSLQFIMFFFKDPKEVINQLDEEYLKSNVLYKKDIAPIRFLKQENLTIELCEVLKKYNFSENEINYIKSHKRVNVTKNKSSNRELLLTKKVINYVNEYEYFYTNVLKDYDVNFNKFV